MEPVQTPPIIQTPAFRDYRCNCGKLLFKSPYFAGCIEVKCRRCGRLKLVWRH